MNKSEFNNSQNFEIVNKKKDDHNQGQIPCIIRQMLHKKLKFPLDDIPSYPGPTHWCASCCHNLSSEVYVSCTICKNVDLCLPCYAKGTNINKHFKEHPVFVITPNDQFGFEVGWKLREELVLVEALSNEYSFKWDVIANAIQTKGPEEIRRHFFKVYIAAIKAPDPRGGSSLNYRNSRGFIFLEQTNICNSKVQTNLQSKTKSYSPKSFDNSKTINSSKLTTESSLTQTETQETSKSSIGIVKNWSAFSDISNSMKESNKSSECANDKQRERITNSDMYGYSLGREEFELGEEDLPEYAVLNVKLEEKDSKEIFYQKLGILQAYDSSVKNLEQCDTALSKLKSFRNLMAKPYKKPKNGQQASMYLKVPISEFSKIEPENFGLINYAEDPNEIEEISKIIHETQTFFNQNHLTQNDGGIPSGTPLQAALFEHLARKKVLSLGIEGKDKESNETDDEPEESIETSNSDENSKQNAAKTKKVNKKKKKTPKSPNIRIGLSGSELNEWNEIAPLAEKAHLYDSFYLKFMSQQEINFIEEKRINATFYHKVKGTILPFIIGNLDRKSISQKLVQLYPNFLIEANLIVDYLLDSKLY